MVDCVEDDGTTPLVAGECGSNNWSGYLNSNKDVQFGDTEKLENIYNKPKGWLNRMIDRYAICTSEDMVTGLKEFTQLNTTFLFSTPEYSIS